MKTYFILMVIMAGALLSGCATGNNEPALATVGPPLPPPAAAGTAGTLVVYSAIKRNADFNARDPNRPEYSDYKIFTTDGKLLKKVHNNSGTILQDPVSVELSPGKYNVVVRANGHGYMTVPVMIAARQSTILHVEGDFKPDESASDQNNVVRSPDGQIIGWETVTNL
jgi:hypothetical protein